MKFKLIKDKEFFQIVCDKKSVKEIIDWDSKAYEIEWYASTKDKDRMNDIVEPSAFENTLKQYMTNPIVLLQHDMDKPIGNVTEASIDDKGLFIKAKITEDTDGVFSKLKNGVLRTFSIWYRVNDFETMENVDSEWNYSYTNLIKDLELFEISLVSVPANPFALVKSFDSCFKAEEEMETAEEPTEEVVDSKVIDDSMVEEDTKKEIEETNEQESEENAHSEEEWAENEEKVEEEVKEEESEEEKVVEEEQPEEEPTEEVVEEVKEIWTAVEWEIVEWEEVVEDETPADEQSEISTASDCDDSENDSETESNDEVVDETSNNEVVEESKSINVEHKSIEVAEFNSFVKSFNQKLDEKDEQIKSLQKQIANQSELMKWAIEVMIQLENAVKHTAIQSWSSYQAPASKNSWQYGKIAQLLKKANS